MGHRAEGRKGKGRDPAKGRLEAENAGEAGRNTDRSAAIALSAILLLVCVGVLIALRGRYLRPVAP